MLKVNSTMIKCLSVSYIMQDKQISSDVNQILYYISPVIVKCGMGEGCHIQCIWEVIIIKVIYPYIPAVLVLIDFE